MKRSLNQRPFRKGGEQDSVDYFRSEVKNRRFKFRCRPSFQKEVTMTDYCVINDDISDVDEDNNKFVKKKSLNDMFSEANSIFKFQPLKFSNLAFEAQEKIQNDESSIKSDREHIRKRRRRLRNLVYQYMQNSTTDNNYSNDKSDELDNNTNYLEEDNIKSSNSW